MIIKKIIAVFDDDKYFLAMMKGYCYVNNIILKEINFNLQGINELEKLPYDLIILPLDGLTIPNKRVEIDLIKKIALNNQLKICALNRNYTESILLNLSEWIDVIISNPHDIAEIDAYLIKIFCIKKSKIERRSNGERRIHKDGRNHYDNGEDIISRNTDFQYGEVESEDFKIDYRNKCLSLKGNKINLTPKEFGLLDLLLTDMDRVFLNEEIIAYLWPESDRATKADLYQYMHLLRKKIEKNLNNPTLILTVRGFGYKLNLEGIQSTYY
jgi:DNA-binding response OmpR family regulator